MLQSEGIEKASELLWESWQNGLAIDDLPPECSPGTRAEGYAIQALLEAQSRKPLFGWKIAATSKAGQDHIAVSGPMAGRLLAESVFDDGAVLDLAGNRMRVAEPEFAFRLGRDLPPRDVPWSVEDVLDAVATLHPSIEIPDSRFADFVIAGEAKLIADNACGHQFVLGAATGADWRALDLSAHPVHAGIAGRYERDGIGANVLDDPRIALAWLVNEVNALGITAKAGEVVTTGTCMAPLEILSGDRVQADFGVLGTVGVDLSAE
ncbi:MAG TPA: hydratase [Afifellaceae bacterium]|nr:hydratase [Afifellaceae bacterium]